MTQNGPQPGQSPHPWSGAGADRPYQEPADPWGENNEPQQPARYRGSAPAYPVTAADQPQPWAAPRPPSKRRGRLVVLLGTVLAALACGGLSAAGWWLSRDPSSAGVSGATVPATPVPTTAVAAPGPRSSQDARFVAKGQCVRNEGTADAPKMAIAVCGGGTYLVLKRLDGHTTSQADAQEKCAKTPQYTKWYFFDSELDSLDFVLCLREHTP